MITIDADKDKTKSNSSRMKLKSWCNVLTMADALEALAAVCKDTSTRALMLAVLNRITAFQQWTMIKY